MWLPGAPAAGPPPVVLFVHGGAWRTGLRDGLGPRFRAWRPGPFARLARAGFAVACPDHRLSAEAVFPAPPDDLAEAPARLRTRAPGFGIDPQRTVAGASPRAALSPRCSPSPRPRAPCAAASSGTAPPTSPPRPRTARKRHSSAHPPPRSRTAPAPPAPWHGPRPGAGPLATTGTGAYPRTSSWKSKAYRDAR
ncbi:hypothetical protein ACVV2G_24575 [Streptomyces ziwulingensis]